MDKKKRRMIHTAAFLSTAVCVLSACQTKNAAVSDTKDETILTVGFAQVGEESDWRRANTRSVEEAFSTENGYRLLFDDAQNNPENQITAIRNFIQQQVDYIILEPIVETGWDTVLTEAKEAGIPVVTADRKLVVEDESLYAAWLGSDNLLEGQKVCEWLHAYAQEKGLDESAFRIVNLQGTLGSAPQAGRDQALMEAAEVYGWQVLEQTRGEFTQAKGREAMNEMLKKYPELNIVYCDNDNEAYGAIEAIEEAGRTPGCDIENGEILLVSFDAAKKGLSYVMDGKIACDGDCNPLHGPRLKIIIEKLKNGEAVDKITYVEEKIYALDDTVKEIAVNGTAYPVTRVTEDILKNCVY